MYGVGIDALSIEIEPTSNDAVGLKIKPPYEFDPYAVTLGAVESL